MRWFVVAVSFARCFVLAIDVVVVAIVVVAIVVVVRLFVWSPRDGHSIFWWQTNHTEQRNV